MGKKRNFVSDENVDDIIERHRAVTGFGVSEAVCDLIRKGWRLENLDEAANPLIPIIRETVGGYAAPAFECASMAADERAEGILAAIDDVKKLVLMDMRLSGALADMEALVEASAAVDDIMDGRAWI